MPARGSGVGALALAALVATTGAQRTIATAAQPLETRPLPAPVVVRVQVDTDLLAYDLCLAPDRDARLEAVAAKALERMLDPASLYLLDLPQLQPSWKDAHNALKHEHKSTGVLRDLSGAAIVYDRSLKRQLKDVYSKCAADAIVKLIAIIRARRPGVRLGVTEAAARAAQAPPESAADLLAAADFLHQPIADKHAQKLARKTRKWTRKGKSQDVIDTRAAAWLLKKAKLKGDAATAGSAPVILDIAGGAVIVAPIGSADPAALARTPRKEDADVWARARAQEQADPEAVGEPAPQPLPSAADDEPAPKEDAPAPISHTEPTPEPAPSPAPAPDPTPEPSPTPAPQGSPPPPAPEPQPAPSPGPSPEPLWGFSTFPFDMTAAAVDATHDFVTSNSTVHLIQLDNGVPWAEALANEPFPAEVEAKWADLANRAPTDQPVHLALAPLAFDRVSLAPASAGSSTPPSIAGAPFDSPDVKAAYLNYARRAVERFDPVWINLGLEAGELAQRRPADWPAFVELIKSVASALKQENPGLQVGISFGLQSLMQDEIAQRVKPFVESMDYLGISFYPYMSAFHERFGVAALPPPPDEWRAAFTFLRTYTTTPIAITETGYNSAPASDSAHGLSLDGSEALQEQYLRELIAEARAQGWLFVIWWAPIDLERILATAPAGGAAMLWWANGLLDSSLREKPALRVWREEALKR